MSIIYNKKISIGLIGISSFLSTNTSFAYSCAILFPEVVYSSSTTYPNSGFAIEDYVLLNRLPDNNADEQLQLAQHYEHVKAPFYLSDPKQQRLNYTYRTLIQGYTWAQPTSPFQANQSYTFDLSPLKEYAFDPEQDLKSTFTVTSQPYQLPQNVANHQQIQFKSSQFVTEDEFQNLGGEQRLTLDLISRYNLKDYLLLVRLKRAFSAEEIQFIHTDLQRHSDHHVTLQFVHHLCGNSFEFAENQHWMIKIDLISPNGQIIPQSNPAYHFNTSGDAQLSFWQKLKRWWADFLAKIF